MGCICVDFSGSSPCEEADDIFPFGIEAANKYDKISICDTYGTHLSACLEKSPTIVHNNIDEVESSLNISLKSEKGKTEYLESLYSKGIKQAYLTDGEKEIYASTLDYKFKIIPPKIAAIDPTGSGDAFTAGIVYGWHHDLTFDETIKLACSLGSVNAGSFSVCEVLKQQAEKYLDDVQILSIGKKMKLLDVTPNNIWLTSYFIFFLIVISTINKKNCSWKQHLHRNTNTAMGSGDSFTFGLSRFN